MSDAYIYRSTLRELLRTKNLIGLGLLVLLCPVLAGLWRVNAVAAGKFVAEDVYNVLMTGLVFGFALLILAVVFGTATISQEVEGKTIVYLLTRPIPRWRLLLMKFLAVNTVVIGALWLSTLLIALVTFGPGGLSGSPLLRDLGILPIVALAYGGLFLLLGVMMNRAMLVGLLFAFGWESWVPNLPGSFHRLSLMTYARVLAPHTKDDPAAQMMAAMTGNAPDVIPNGAAWTILLVVIAFTLLTSLSLFSTREYVPREEAG